MIYFGIDASGDKGFAINFKSTNYFTLTAVSCSNFRAATNLVKKLDSRWPGLKGKDLHPYWEEVLELLNKYDLRYYLLTYNKRQINQIVANKYKQLRFQGMARRYTLSYKRHAQHGWLAIQTLINFKYQGSTEIRVCRDLSGSAWKTYKKEVKNHAEKHLKAPCDIQDETDEYPLIRIADIVSNFAFHQIEKNFKVYELDVVKKFLPRIAIMKFDLKFVGIDPITHMAQYTAEMKTEIQKKFTPYNNWFSLRIIVQKAILHIKSRFRAI